MSLDPNVNETLWVQKYRPRRVADTILPESTKSKFQKFVDEGNAPNLLLSGSPGTGKTTVAKAMLDEIGCDHIVINGSLNNGIDMLRTTVSNFASSVSLAGGRKFVIVDEADYLNSNSVQPALRNFIEEYSKNCGFIFTCNFKDRIIPPLRSRFTEINFGIKKDDRPRLAAQFFKRVTGILSNEKIEYDQATVAKVLERHFPDFRRVLNELQGYAATGKIDEGIFANLKSESVDELFDMLKAKKFTDMRKWVASNSDLDATELFRRFYDIASDRVELRSMPGFVVTLGEYQYKHAFVADPEINLVAFLTTIMMETDFK